MKFLENKLTPPMKLLESWLKGRNWANEPFTWKDALRRAFTPISIQNALEVSDNPSADNVVGAVLGFIGIRTNSFTDNRDMKPDITNRIRDGVNLTKSQQTMYDEMRRKKQRKIKDAAAKTITEAAFGEMSADEAAFAYKHLNANEKIVLRDVMRRKIHRSKKTVSEKRDMKRTLLGEK